MDIIKVDGHVVGEELTTTGNVDIAQQQHLPMDKALELADMLSKSTIVPMAYQNRPENCYIALELAHRMGLPAMMVMQNLFVVQGKPSWSGTACATLIKTSGRFKDDELVYVGERGTDEWGAYVKAIRKSDGKEVKGSTVTIGTAKAEGWYNKNGSKWKTMPELMLAYRASAWFARVYCPETMMGLQTTEEVEDVSVGVDTATNPYEEV